jgi:DNA-binding CsgD family transcriptional regulator
MLSAAALDRAASDLPVALELLVAAGGVAEAPALTGEAWYQAAVAGYLTGQHRRVLDLVAAVRRLEGSGIPHTHLDRLQALAGVHVLGIDATLVDVEAAAERAGAAGDSTAALSLLLIAGVLALYGCRLEHLAELAERGRSLAGTDPLSRATVSVFSASAGLYTRTDARGVRELGPILATLVDAPPSSPIPDLDLDVSRSMFYGGLLLMTDEQWDRARSLLCCVVDRDRNAGWTGLEGLNVAWYAELLWRVGAWREAQAIAREALDARGAALGRSRLWIEAFCAKVAVLTGDASAAARHQISVQEVDPGSPLHVPLVAVLLHAGLGLGRLGDGDAEGAVDHLRIAGSLAGPVSHPGLVWYRADLVEALAAAGHRAEAQAEADALRQTLNAGAPPVLAGRVLRARGLASGAKRGLGALRRAVEAHERGGAPFELARSLLALAEAGRALGEEADLTTASATRAAELFERLGAPSFAARSRNIGVLPGSVSARLVGLTGREGEVARLVAAGATNQDVAVTLGVSPKTVSFHLGGVFRKLRITSRSQLAVLLGDRGSG